MPSLFWYELSRVWYDPERRTFTNRLPFMEVSMIPALATPPLRNESALRIAFGGCGVTMPMACKMAHINSTDTRAVLDTLGKLLLFSASEWCLPGPTKDPNFNTTYEVRTLWSTMTADE